MSLRHPLILGALSLALAVSVPLAGVVTVEAVRQLEGLYVDGSGESNLTDMAAVLRAQAIAYLVPALSGWLALAAAVPGIGALVLLVERQRRQTGSASATASRDASRSSATSSGSAESSSAS